MHLRNRKHAEFTSSRVVIATAAATFALCCADGSSGPTSVGEDASKSAPMSEARQVRPLGPRRPPTTNRGVPFEIASAWGGEHIGLELETDRGKVELDCAHGTIDEPFTLAADGSFSVRGTFTPEHGGPISDAEVANTRPARYEGVVRGDEMTLTILVDGRPLPFRYTLRRDEFPRIVKCL